MGREIYGYTYEEPEQWKEVWGFGRYYISTWGRIINVYTSKELVSRAYSNDYPLRVNLIDDSGWPETKLVHRLVAEAFMANYHPDKQITFVDGDRWNPHILNLEPVAEIAGMFVSGVKWVPLRRLFSGDGRSFRSVIEAAKNTGLHRSEIYDQLEGRRKILREYQFEWRWIEEVADGSELISWSGIGPRFLRERPDFSW